MDRLEVITAHIDWFLERKDSVLVAIDGKCTSGKTTLSRKLAEHYDCNVMHMDDFFLRPEQRTATRLSQVGGNVDYERFQAEVLTPLLSGDPFSYRPFDCKTFSLSEAIAVMPKKLNIIEGSYAMHPHFGDPYDLRILLTVDPETQRQRIGERPAHLQERFLTQWIPMENQYLEEFCISQKADLIL